MTKPFILLAAVMCLWAGAGHAVTFDVPAQALGDVAEGAVSAAAFFLANFAAVAILILIALCLRYWIWALYTLLVFLGLLYIALFEQNITGIVWSGMDVSAQGLIAGGYAMLSINYLVAAYTLPTDHRWAWLKTPFCVAAVGIWGIWALGRTAPVEVGYLLFSITGCTVAIAHFFPVSTFTKLRGGYDIIIRNLIWGLLVCVLIGGTFVIAGAFEGQDLTVIINRVLIAAITIAFGGLFIRNIFVLKSDRELAVQEALERAVEQARISEELLAAKDSYNEAVEVAHARTLRLATASHDIRQPLSSLRTSFAALARDMPEDTRSHLQQSLDYLDELASSYVSEASTFSEAHHGHGDAAPDPDTDEQVRAEQIGATLQRMFEDDAAARDLTLQVGITPAPLDTQPLALMRVLCNLMSNAIAHGTPGTLRLEGHAEAPGYTFTVSNPGAASLDFGAWNKGDASEGSGLGLAIVQEQATRAGLVLATPDCAPDRTCVSVTLPAPA
ncbi:sensor histidine kinase [Gymnodinialimonas sp.]